MICPNFRLLAVIPLFRVCEGTCERKYYAFLMLSKNIQSNFVSRRGHEAIWHTHLKLAGMNGTFICPNIRKLHLLWKVDFFVSFGVYWLVKNYSWIITWINQRYLCGIAQIYFTYTYTRVCMHICVYTYTLYVCMSIYMYTPKACDFIIFSVCYVIPTA